MGSFQRWREAPHPYLILGLLSFLNLLNYIDRFLLNGVLTPIQLEFGLDDGQLGRLNTAFMMGYFICSPLFGWLADRWPRKWIIAFGVGVGGLGTMATSWAPTFAALLAIRMFVGFAEAGYGTAGPSLIADYFTGAKRNFAFSIYYVALPVGAALGYVLGGQLHEIIGWRQTFFWIGALSLVVAFVLQPFREPIRGSNEQREWVPPTGRDFLRLIVNSRFLLVVGGYVAYTFAMGALAVWAPIFLQRFHGESNSESTLFFGITAVVTGLVGTLLGGWVTSKLSHRFAWIYDAMLAMSCAGAIPFFLWALYAESAIGTKVGFFFAMFFLFLSTGPINTVILQKVPVNLRASAIALTIFAIHFFGDLWSPELIGHASDAWGNLRQALSVLAIAFFLGAVLWGVPIFSRRESSGV